MCFLKKVNNFFQASSHAWAWSRGVPPQRKMPIEKEIEQGCTKNKQDGKNTEKNTPSPHPQKLHMRICNGIIATGHNHGHTMFKYPARSLEATGKYDFHKAASVSLFLLS